MVLENIFISQLKDRYEIHVWWAFSSLCFCPEDGHNMLCAMSDTCESEDEMEIWKHGIAERMKLDPTANSPDLPDQNWKRFS
jgi:hypothetical protein